MNPQVEQYFRRILGLEKDFEYDKDGNLIKKPLVPLRPELDEVLESYNAGLVNAEIPMSRSIFPLLAHLAGYRMRIDGPAMFQGAVPQPVEASVPSRVPVVRPDLTAIVAGESSVEFMWHRKRLVGTVKKRTPKTVSVVFQHANQTKRTKVLVKDVLKVIADNGDVKAAKG